MWNPNFLDSGDLVLFANKSWSLRDKVLNTPTRWLTWANWTHCGIIYKQKAFNPLLFESQKCDSITDVHYSVNISGVQCVPFLKRFFSYSGDVYIRKFCGTVDNSLFLDKILDYSCKPFCRNPYRLMRSISWLNWLPKCCDDGNSMFCSELLVKIYQDLGVLSKEIEPGHYSPLDFTPNGRLQYHLNQGYGWGPLHLLAKTTER